MKLELEKCDVKAAAKPLSVHSITRVSSRNDARIGTVKEASLVPLLGGLACLSTTSCSG